MKFKPFWDASILVLVAAAGTTEGEAVLWPLLLEFIQSTGRLQMTGSETEDSSPLDDGAHGDNLSVHGVNGGAIRAFVTLLHDSTGIPIQSFDTYQTCYITHTLQHSLHRYGSGVCVRLPSAKSRLLLPRPRGSCRPRRV